MKVRLTPKNTQKLRIRQRIIIVSAASTITALVVGLIFLFNIGNVRDAFASGKTYYSRASGSWNSSSTWSTSQLGGSAATSFPQAGDVVIISGYTVTVNSNSAAASISVIQDKGRETTFQVIDGKLLTVSGNMEIAADEHKDNVNLNISGDKTSVNVGGDFIVSKTKGSSQGQLNVSVSNTSNLAIAGSFVANYQEGQGDINITFTDYASLNVGEDIVLTESKGKDDLIVSMEDNAIVNVDGDITFDAEQKGQITFIMSDNSQTLLGGSIFNNNADQTINSFQSTDDSKLTLTGKTAEIVIGSEDATEIFTIENLVINTSNNQKVKIVSNVLVTGQLTFIQGIVETTADAMITLGSNAVSTGSSAQSFVDGPMAKQGSTAFIFPVGDAGKYAPISITAPVSSSTFTAEYFNSPYQLATTSYQTPLKNVSGVEYWKLQRTSGTGNTQVELYWLDAQYSGIATMSDLQVANLDPVNNTWKGVGSKVVSLSTSQGSATSNSLGSFGIFTFGSSGGSALPVSLISFDAKAKADYVQLSWATAWENNNDYFSVERSEDGKNFDVIGKVKGSGNATEKIKYGYEDKEPLPGISYYRLKQTDFNGQFEYFPIKSVNIPFATIDKVGPNPFNNLISINYNMLKEAPVTIQLLNSSGNVVFEEATHASVGNNSYTISNQDQLPKGMYILRINAAGQPVNYKLVKS